MADKRTVYDFLMKIGGRVDGSFTKAARKATDTAVGIGRSISTGFREAADSAVNSIGSIGVAIGATMGMDAAIDTQIGFAKLQAQVGATTEEIKGLKEESKEIYATGLVDSLEEANNIVSQIERATKGMSKADKEALTKGVTTIGFTYDIDAEELARVQRTMTQTFGEDVNHSLDLIAYGFQNNLDYSGEFLDTLNEYGPQFKAAGYSADEMFNILVAGTEAGAWNLDKVGDAAKEFGIRIKDGSKTTEEAMGQLSKPTRKLYKDMLNGNASVADVMSAVTKELSGMKDQTKAFQIAQGLFGTMSEDLTLETLYGLQNINSAADDAAGTLQKMQDTLSGDSGVRAKAAINSMQTSFGEIGAEILTAAVPAIEKLSVGIEWISDEFAGLNPNVKTAIVVIGGLAAGVGILVPLVGAGITVFSGLGAVIGGVAGAIGMLTGPVGIAIAVIGGLITVGVLLYKNWDTIKMKAGELSTAVQGFFIDMKDGIVGAFKGGINGAIGIVNNGISSINKLAFDVPEWVPGVGGKHFGLNIPAIPALADGGIATKPTLAMIGEGREEEAVLPLSKLDNLLSGSTGGLSIINNFTITGGVNVEREARKIADIVNKQIEQYLRQQKRLSLGGV